MANPHWLEVCLGMLTLIDAGELADDEDTFSIVDRTRLRGEYTTRTAPRFSHPSPSLRAPHAADAGALAGPHDWAVPGDVPGTFSSRDFVLFIRRPEGIRSRVIR